jgi:hypothetical protein
MNQTIKRLAMEAMLNSSPLQLIEAVVVSSPPDIKIKLKDNAKLVIPNDLIMVSEHLTRHTGTGNISNANVSGNLSDAGDPKHTHNIQSLSLSNAKIDFTDELKNGDRVMVAAIQGGQSFFIIDRFKSY